MNPITLSGRIVRLDPMRLEDAPALAEVGMAPELWRLQLRISERARTPKPSCCS